VQQEQMVLVSWGLLASAGVRDHQGRKGYREFREQCRCRGLREFRAAQGLLLLEIRGFRAEQELQQLWGRWVRRELKESLEQRVQLLDPRVRRVPQQRMGLQDPWVLLELRVLLVPMHHQQGLQVLLVPTGPLEQSVPLGRRVLREMEGVLGLLVPLVPAGLPEQLVPQVPTGPLEQSVPLGRRVLREMEGVLGLLVPLGHQVPLAAPASQVPMQQWVHKGLLEPTASQLELLDPQVQQAPLVVGDRRVLREHWVARALRVLRDLLQLDLVEAAAPTAQLVQPDLMGHRVLRELVVLWGPQVVLV